MSYFKSSFLAAVLAKTLISTSSSCEKLVYIHSMPEISLKKDGHHVILGTADGGTITHTTVESRGSGYDPLMLAKDEQSAMLALHQHHI